MFQWDGMDVLGARARRGTCTHRAGSVQIHRNAHVTHTSFFSALQSNKSRFFILGEEVSPVAPAPLPGLSFYI